MNCFVVVLPPDSTVSPKTIPEHFPKNHTLVPNRAWVVAGKQETCSDVCDLLGIGGEKDKSDDPTGLVVKADNYYGFADMALWDHMRVWEENT